LPWRPAPCRSSSLDAAIGAALAPYRAAVEHLVTIPGGYEVTLRPAA